MGFRPEALGASFDQRAEHGTDFFGLFDHLVSGPGFDEPRVFRDLELCDYLCNRTFRDIKEAHGIFVRIPFVSLPPARSPLTMLLTI